MEDLSKEFRDAYAALGRLDSSLKAAEKSKKGKRTERSLENSRRIIEESLEEIRTAEKDLGRLEEQTGDYLDRANKIGMD